MSQRKRVQKFFDKPSRTKQSFKDECDINKIMQRFKKVMSSDYLSQFNQVVGGQFGDFSMVSDYRSALDQINAAEAVFEALPAVVRKRFDNDPALFLDFVDNPANADEMVSLGLAVAKPVVNDPLFSGSVSKPVTNPGT